MNEIAINGDKRMTVREVAEVLGISSYRLYNFIFNWRPMAGRGK